MTNQEQKLKRTKLNFLEKFSNFSKAFGSKNIVVGSIIGTLIATTPFIFNLYQSVPNEKIWNTFLFVYDSKYYESARVAAWTITNQLVPLMLLFIWFFTCRHWWYHSILVPIIMFVYQAIETLNSDLYITDQNLILYLLPIMAIIIPSIYLIRAQMFNKLNDADKSFEELEEEFMIKPTTFWSKLKQYF